MSGQGWGGATLKPDPAPARGTKGATFSDRPSGIGQRYVFSPAVTAVIAWRAVCLVPELVQSVCAAPYIHLRN